MDGLLGGDFFMVTLRNGDADRQVEDLKIGTADENGRPFFQFCWCGVIY